MKMYFYHMVSARIGRMTVSHFDREMMIKDREDALVDNDKSEVSELLERDMTETEKWCIL